MKTIGQIALEVANNQYEFIWTEGCGYEGGVLPQEAIDFAKAFLAAVDAERGEPVAWSYTSKITGAETLTHQPPDRVIEHEQFVIHPLYLAPQPTDTNRWKAAGMREAAEICDNEAGEYGTDSNEWCALRSIATYLQEQADELEGKK